MPAQGWKASAVLVVVSLSLLIPWNVVGTIWQIYGRADIGLLGAALNALGVDYNYTGNATHAWLTVLVMDVWHWTPHRRRQQADIGAAVDLPDGADHVPRNQQRQRDHDQHGRGLPALGRHGQGQGDAQRDLHQQHGQRKADLAQQEIGRASCRERV